MQRFIFLPVNIPVGLDRLNDEDRFDANDQFQRNIDVYNKANE